MPTDPDIDAEIVADNVRAVGAIYAAYMLEELGVFRVLERIAELFRQGLLPLRPGRVAEALFRAARPGEGMSARDRAAFYAQVLGAPGGEGGGQPNREFLSLWMRFLVSVSMYVRQHGAAALMQPPTTTNAAVRAAARALAANASSHGGGVMQFAAQELNQQVQQMIKLLNEPELLQAFGARDGWQVIDRVSRDHLGGARDVVRYRTQASAGSRIFEWLADHGSALHDPAAAPGAVPNDDAQLVEAAEAWLAASAGGASESELPADAAPPDLRIFVHDLVAAVGLAVGKLSRGAASAGRGIAVLLHGPRRSGRTLAAHLLAHAMGLDVLRVDLAAVTSKYIGETEKNLDTLFDRAEKADAILFFDEADALFGRRSEVKDSHDRYANVEIDYLLQRIETYKGPVIVATDSQANIDAAFAQELWCGRHWRVVPFPRPRG